MANHDKLIARAAALLEQLGQRDAHPAAQPDWDASIAFRWRGHGGGLLLPVARPQRVALSDLIGIESQKRALERNTRQFVAGLPANNVLLTGARGTGKSSLVKAVLNRYARRRLRLIEVDRHDLVQLADIVDRIAERPERFIVFCDDLSFSADEPGFRALKVALEGTIAATSENLLIYATSNRRHLMPEPMEENLQARRIGDEIHPGEAVEEKVSLSDRFGLWISFYPFSQEDYLAIVGHWLARFGVSGRGSAAVQRAALQWATQRGSRSGRTAWQFARDWAGRQGLGKKG